MNREARVRGRLYKLVYTFVCQKIGFSHLFRIMRLSRDIDIDEGGKGSDVFDDVGTEVMSMFQR
jgi:hypothetical protein